MTERVEIDEASAGRRLDVVVAEVVGISRSRAGDLVTSGGVTVGGRTERKSYRVSVGDTVEIAEPVAAVPSAPPAVDVVFEDEHLIVVSKQAGVVVHPAPGLREGTVVDALRARGCRLAHGSGDDRPGVVHRLDRDVSGLLVLAKTDEAYARIVRDMAARRIDRRYLALVSGSPSVERGKIEAPIGRHPRHRTRMAVLPEGRAAITWFEVLERFEPPATLLEVRLETGRTHQIRTHLAAISHPVVGDAAYGHDPRLARSVGLERPFLHACRLGFDHPVSGERVELTSELPRELERVLEEMRA